MLFCWEGWHVVLLGGLACCFVGRVGMFMKDGLHLSGKGAALRVVTNRLHFILSGSFTPPIK